MLQHATPSCTCSYYRNIASAFDLQQLSLAFSTAVNTYHNEYYYYTWLCSYINPFLPGVSCTVSTNLAGIVHHLSSPPQQVSNSIARL